MLWSVSLLGLNDHAWLMHTLHCPELGLESFWQPFGICSTTFFDSFMRMYNRLDTGAVLETAPFLQQALTKSILLKGTIASKEAASVRGVVHLLAELSVGNACTAW